MLLTRMGRPPCNMQWIPEPSTMKRFLFFQRTRTDSTVKRKEMIIYMKRGGERAGSCRTTLLESVPATRAIVSGFGFRRADGFLWRAVGGFGLLSRLFIEFQPSGAFGCKHLILGICCNLRWPSIQIQFGFVLLYVSPAHCLLFYSSLNLFYLSKFGQKHIDGRACIYIHSMVKISLRMKGELIYHFYWFVP